MRLPVSVAFHPDVETPVSLASRLARAMAYPSVTDLLGGQSVQEVARGDEDAIKMLSSWSGVPVDQLLRFAVPTSSEAREWRLGDAVFRKEMRVAGFRFCPRCLVEDMDIGSGRPAARPYERASWLTRGVTACTCHGELLVEAKDDAPASDVALFVAEGWHLKHRPGAPADRAELEVDSYIEGRISGHRTQSFIDRQEVHVLVMLFQFLGWFVHNRNPTFHIGGVAGETLSVRAVGFKIAAEGSKAIEAAVKQAIDVHRPAAHTIREFFGPMMVRHLRRTADVPAYAEVIALFHDLVERFTPVGAGDRFVHPIERRLLHSVRSAAVDYSMDRKRVRKILEERGIVERSKLTDRRVYFSVEHAEDVLGAATRALTTVEAAEVLGTNENRVREIIERGLLPYSECGAKGKRPYYRVALSDLDLFRERLFERAGTDRNGLVSLDAACRRRSLTRHDIIEMIMAGKLTRIARADESMRLDRLLVDLRELPVSTDGNHGEDDYGNEGIYLNMTEVRIALSTTDATVSALVKHSVLPVEVRTNPRTRRPQPFVHRDSVDAFLENHRSLHRIASGWRRNIAWMKDELDQNDMKPIFETSGKIARYYRIEDLEKACLLPPNT